MTGRGADIPDPERRRAANTALTDLIEEVCRHYAPSGARVEDCWEVGGAGERLSLRVFLAGPMRGSWTDAATGARGDALDLVACLGGLDAAGALAEAERFLRRNAAGPEPKAGDVGGQMGLFGALPESGGRKRPVRRSAKGGNASTSRRAALPHEPPAGDPGLCPGDEPAGDDDATGGSQALPDAPEDRKKAPPPSEPVPSARPEPAESGHAVPSPDGLGFTAEDRQRLRKAAEDAAWLRSRQTIRLLDAQAQGRAKARRERQGRRWRRTGLWAAGVLALAVFGPILGVMGEYRYGVVDRASVLGAELPEEVRVLPGGNGG